MGVPAELWDKRTELEKGLILVLIIIVPLCLLICGLYIHFSQRKSDINDQPFEPLNDTMNYNNPDDMKRNMSEILIIYNNRKTNHSLNKVAKRSISICDCHNIFEAHTFISSISETIFEDEPNEFKFKCSATVLTESYILTFLNCLSKNITIKIRSSSKYWSKDGYIRQISNFVNLNNSLSIAKLTKPLPNREITMVANHLDFKFIKQLDLFRWNSKFTSDMKRRSKYDKLNKIRLNVTKCMKYYKNLDGFCALEKRNPLTNDLDSRDPIFQIDSNKLIGMEINRLIWKDKIEHYYLFIRNRDIEKYIK